MNNRTHDDDTSPESTATIPPVIGEFRVCAWTGTAWHDYGVNMETVVQTLKMQHTAIDSLFAKLIAIDPTFMPSEHPEFAVARQGLAIIDALKPRPTE